MNKIFEWATSAGKTKAALDASNNLEPGQWNLVVVPKLVLIKEWKKEIKKWGYDERNFDFVTYASLHKKVNTFYKNCLIDECFSGDTEILTDKGWKKFIDLDKTESVAQWENGKISFVKPLNYIKRMHNDKMLKVHLGRNRFCMMTPNHKQVYKYKEGEWCLKEIKEIKATYDYKIPLSGYGTGNNNLLTPLERMFIAIQADGTLQRHQINESVYSIQVTRDRKKERLNQILSELDNWTCIKGREEVDRYMIKLPKGDAKLLSTHFDVNMGKDRAEDFIQEVAEWDGSRYNKGMVYYSSKLKENTDFVSAIAIQAGYRVRYGVEKDDRKENYSDIHRLYMTKQEEFDCQIFKKNEYIDFNDFVYCVEVPSHKIVVRSEGYSFISGNCHHITDRVKDILNCMHVENWYFLSATLSRDMKFYLQMKFNAILDTKTLRDQIDIGRLPEPEVILIPLQLDNQLAMFPVKKKYNGKEYTKMLTQRGLIDDMQGLIDWYKNKVVNLGNSAMKFRWLSKCLERNKQLSMFKEEYTKRILDTLKNERTLTFCCDIKQSNRLGENSIDSKNKKAQEVLDDFNEKKINHITAINCVNEGCNLSDCEYCVFNFLSSSFLVSCQRVGRSLRHPNPKIIIPYFENTREEEQLEKMLIDIDAQNVKKTTLSIFEHKYGD